MIITIDGPVASGKSTLAKNLSREMNAFYICSGLFYRAFAYITGNIFEIDIKDENAVLKALSNINFVYLNDEKYSPIVIYNEQDITQFLQTEQIGDNASLISPIPKLRSIINDMQRNCIKNEYNCIIADGRDCGTTVFPNANLKFYITASLEARISRIKNRNSKSENENLKLVKFILERDLRDSSRKISPAKPAFDSYVIDTSYMQVNEVLNFSKKLIDGYL